MEIRSVVVAAFAIFALLQFGLLPKLKSAWDTLPWAKKLKQAGLIAVCEKVRDYSLIAGSVYLLFGAFVLLAGIGSSDSVDAIMSALNRTRTANEWLKQFKEFWASWTFFVSFLVLGWAWYRSVRKHASQKLSELQVKEYERLLKAREEGSSEWRDLPPTPQMEVVQAALHSTIGEMDEMRARGAEEQMIERKRQHAQELLQLWTMLDLDRRAEISWETVPVSPEGRAFKLRRILASKGFVADIKGFGKILSHGCTALLALSLLGFAAGAAEIAVADHVAKLSDLQVTTSQEESEKTLRRAEASVQQPQQASSPLTSVEHLRIERFSRQVAQQIRRDSHLNTVDADLRRETVKEQIRRETVAVPEHGMDKPAESNAEEDEIIAQSDKTQNDILGQKIASEIRKEAEQNAGFREKLRTWIARYDEPAQVPELRDFFAEQLTDALWDGVPKPSNPVADKIAGLFTDQLKKRAGSAVKTAENHMMTAILKDMPLDDAMARIRTEDSLRTILSVDDADRIFKEYPGLGVQHAWAEAVRQKRLHALSAEDDHLAGQVQEAINGLPVDFKLDHEAELANLASSFESEFALEAKSYARDEVFESLLATHKTAQTLLKEKGYNLADLADINGIETRTARSLNLEALRNYSRVGGILIGRDLAHSATLDFRDIQWTRSGNLLRVSMRRSDDKWIEVGQFQPRLINRALAYAVDGRPAAVTILNAELIDREQVMIHPAIRDTALGASFGAADEWIFMFLDPDPPAPQSDLRHTLNQMYAESALYGKTLTILKTGKPAMGDVRVARLNELAAQGTPADLLKSKSFDGQLMALARRCASRDSSEAGFANCVLSDASVKLNLDTLKKTSVPRTEFVSQIYEEAYDLDADLHFLHPQHNGDAVWPLRFTVQMTVNDADRIEFPQFRGTSAAASTRLVLNGIRAKGDSAVLDDLRNFTILQRLFRAALAGSLGQNFPIEKLTDFAKSTRTANGSCSTPRWINRKKLAGESAEQAIGLELRQLPATASFKTAAPKPLGDQARARFSACSSFLLTPGSNAAPSNKLLAICKSEAEDAGLNDACRTAKFANTSEACVLEEVDSSLQRLISVHQLREALGAVAVPTHIVPNCSARKLEARR